jgi:hypothetical protein
MAAKVNRHDLGREDEIGLDRTCDFLVLDRLRVQGDRSELGLMPMCTVRHDGLEHLLHPFVAEIGAAQHQQRRNRPRQEVAQHQGRGQQDQQLVAQRSRRDLAHDRQFALRRKSDHVTGRNRGIVDHDACGLCARLGGLARHIIEGGCSRLRDTGYIVEKTDQPDTHRFLPQIICWFAAARLRPVRRQEKSGAQWGAPDHCSFTLRRL